MQQKYFATLFSRIEYLIAVYCHNDFHGNANIMSQSLLLTIISMKAAILFFAALALMHQQQWRLNTSAFLALFLGLYGLLNIDELGHLLGVYQIAPHLMGFIFPFKTMLGPIIFWYVRSALHSEKPRWRKSHWLACAAPILCCLAILPFMLLTSEQKLHMISGEQLDPELYWIAMLGCRAGIALFCLVSTGYLLACWRLMRQHRVRQTHANRYFTRVVTVIALGWSVNVATEFLAIMGYWRESFTSVYHLFELGWIAFIALTGFVPLVASEKVTKLTHNACIRESKNLLLTPEQHSTIAEALNQLMIEKKLFTDPELSLRDLANSVGVRENMISETLSAHIRKNFYEFVNHYRVHDACELIKTEQGTLVDICFAVGFNSRSTFNSAFKKVTGLTPTAYRKCSEKSDFSVSQIA